MISVVKDKNCFIPIDANMFIADSKEYGQKMKYSKEYSISEFFLNRLNQFVYSNINQWEYLVLDMTNICSAPSRNMSCFSEYSSKMIICNVTNTRMKNIISEDLPELISEEDVFFSSIIDKEKLRIIVEDGNQIREKKQKEILSKIIEKERGSYLLESSGLYSNCYINIKKLFLDAEEFQFIVFSMAGVLMENINKYGIDALVSSSKNGAIIAYILGGLLDIKEVHLIGVGPKYAMEIGDAIECIRAGKKYAYIFDFMCTGTESKIVNALINSKKAYMPYAIGIAKYRKESMYIPIKEIDCLVDTEMLDIHYTITGEKQ